MEQESLVLEPETEVVDAAIQKETGLFSFGLDGLSQTLLRHIAKACLVIGIGAGAVGAYALIYSFFVNSAAFANPRGVYLFLLQGLYVYLAYCLFKFARGIQKSLDHADQAELNNALIYLRIVAIGLAVVTILNVATFLWAMLPEDLGRTAF